MKKVKQKCRQMEEKKEKPNFYIIFGYSLYYFNELCVKVEIKILDEL